MHDFNSGGVNICVYIGCRSKGVYMIFNVSAAWML